MPFREMINNDFNQLIGLYLNPDNRWIQMADKISWDLFETPRAGNTVVIYRVIRICVEFFKIQKRILLRLLRQWFRYAIYRKVHPKNGLISRH